MEKFITHTGVAAPLPRSNVNTDDIVPARFLKTVNRTGFADALFANCAPLQLARLLGQLEPVAFAAGQELYPHGAKADALYLIDAGDVELITESGRRLELRTHAAAKKPRPT